MPKTIFDTIETPTLLVDERITRANIRRIVQKARRQNVRFRPHFKTHQSIAIGEWFHEEGVNAITVASTEMARYFLQGGWRDITIAFPVNPRQVHTYNELASESALGLVVESMEGAQALASGITYDMDVWVKVDAGSLRTGVNWQDTRSAANISKMVMQSEHLHLRGLLTHAGHTYGAHGAAAVCVCYTESVTHLLELRQALAAEGLHNLEISVGDTPSATLCDDWGAIDELRPGNFVFYDAKMIQIGACAPADVAVALACPIVALHPERDEVVVHGGAVHLSLDFWLENDRRMYGLAALPGETGWQPPIAGAYVAALSQEHGIVHVPPETLAMLHIGDLLCILPAHSCLTVTQQRNLLTLTGERLTTMADHCLP